MTSKLDIQKVSICPGVGRFLRPGGAGRVTGATQGEQGTMEWQWAQTAMFGYFYDDFKLRYPAWSFVLAENEYTRMLTGILAADDMLTRMTTEFRKDYKAGGALRPDILGFCARSPETSDVVLEFAEVTTNNQAAKTLKEDVQYRVSKFGQIIKAIDPAFKSAFSLSSYNVKAGPTQWRPRGLHQRIVPLPVRNEGGITYIDWICFEPTFWYPWPDGTDGLLLYEIHTMQVKSLNAFPEIVKRLAEQERLRRQGARIAYGVTLTPWLNEDYLNRIPEDRDALRAVAILAGAGLLVALAVSLAPVVAGLELAVLLEPAAAGIASGLTAAGELSAATLATLSTGLTATMATAAQWMTALGRPLASAAAP
jgi:hypothetical protein